MTTGTSREPQETDRPQFSNDEPIALQTPRISGRWLVIGLFMFGMAATALLFVYWDRHTKPFRPLREAIGREFRHSRPNVEGGRPKGRGPWTLRISMTVEFPPAEDAPRAKRVFDRVLQIARQHHDVNEVDKVEVNLIQFVPQELAKTKTFTWTANDSPSDGG